MGSQALRKLARGDAAIGLGIQVPYGGAGGRALAGRGRAAGCSGGGGATGGGGSPLATGGIVLMVFDKP